MDVKQRFTEIIGLDTYKRVDNIHVLDLYLGIDNMSRFSLLLVTPAKPTQMFSSKIICVQTGQRKDEQWAILFSLINNEFEDLFCRFCEDIIESSRIIKDKKNGSEFVCSRYAKWQKMLSRNNSGLLSSSEIKGLIGELYFLKQYLLPKYGEDLAVNSWIGPELADQDFVCKDIWYEVKSTVSGAESILIASIEQLDTKNDGELIIVYLDKTSNSDKSKITLNGIYKEIYDMLTTDNLKQKLSEILLILGYYPRSEYDEFTFRYATMKRYVVTKEFPCIRRTMLPYSVVNTKYELAIPSIGNFLKE